MRQEKSCRKKGGAAVCDRARMQSVFLKRIQRGIASSSFVLRDCGRRAHGLSGDSQNASIGASIGCPEATVSKQRSKILTLFLRYHTTWLCWVTFEL